MGLEDFCSGFAQELGVSFEKDPKEEYLKTAKLDNVTFSYSRAYDHEFFSVSNSDEIEMGLVECSGKDEFITRIGLPSLTYQDLLKRLDNSPLCRKFKELFEKRELDQGSENSKFFEMTKIKDPNEIKDLVYQLFCIDRK